MDYAEIEPLRARRREEATCQLVRDSILPRGLAEPFAVAVGGEVMGYAGVWTEHFPGRVMEFYLAPDVRELAPDAFVRLLEVSDAREIEAQTNDPLLHAMLLRYATGVSAANILFEDGPGSALEAPAVRFRRRRSDDHGPKGDWVLARGGEVVAAGGFLDHYNPPYCDVYLEVLEGKRGRGLGSYLAQELRRVSRASGYVPAARCDVENLASRGALLRGGFVECGRIVAGRVERGR